MRPWRYLVAEPVPGEEGDWTSLFTIDDSQPLYLQESDRLFRYVELDIRTAYVQFRANIGAGLEASLAATDRRPAAGCPCRSAAPHSP